MNRATVVLALVLGSCTSSARSVRSHETLEADRGEGVVIGKVSFGSRTGDPLMEAEFIAIAAATGKKWKVHLDDEQLEDHGQGAPFFVALPAGRYALTKLTMHFNDTDWTMEDMGLEMEVLSGRVSCIGAAYLRAREGSTQAANEETQLVGGFEVRDECAHLGELLRVRAPGLLGAPVVSLVRARR